MICLENGPFYGPRSAQGPSGVEAKLENKKNAMIAHFNLTLAPKTYLAAGMGRRAYSVEEKPLGTEKIPKREVRVRKWVSKKVIARLHNVCLRQVDYWVQDAVVPYRKVRGGKVQFNPLDVERALSVYDVEVVGDE